MDKIITPEKPDSLLIEHYLKGNEIALEYIINKHQQKIFNFIYSKVHDRDLSEDIFQETFIKVIKTLKNGVYNEEGKFLPWVMRISHNLVIDFFRKNNRIQTIKTKKDLDIFQFISDGSPNAESVLVNDQIIKDIQKLIQELPDDQKEVLIMRLYRDMSFKEIAENTKVSINTALGRMRYAIINLRKLISSIEKTIIDTLSYFKIKTFADRKNIGIWHKKNKNIKKVAAIGIKVKKWIAYHGFSVNIVNDLKKYDKIIPCGIEGQKITNLIKIKNQNYKILNDILVKNFLINIEN